MTLPGLAQHRHQSGNPPDSILERMALGMMTSRSPHSNECGSTTVSCSPCLRISFSPPLLVSTNMRPLRLDVDGV
jgi:hypothetical protein